MQKVTKALLDKKSSFLAKSIFVAYSLFLGIATLIPTSVLSSGKKSWLSNINFENGDKVVHTALFFIFSFCFYYSGWAKSKISLLLIPFILGILIECLQGLLGWGRTFDVWDILANCIGSLLAFWAIQFIFQSKHNRSTKF